MRLDRPQTKATKMVATPCPQTEACLLYLVDAHESAILFPRWQLQEMQMQDVSQQRCTALRGLQEVPQQQYAAMRLLQHEGV